MTSERGLQLICESVSGAQALALHGILREYKIDGEPSIPDLHTLSVQRGFFRIPQPGIRPSSSRSFAPDALASPASTESFAPESVPMNPPTGTAEITPPRTPKPSKRISQPSTEKLSPPERDYTSALALKTWSLPGRNYKLQRPSPVSSRSSPSSSYCTYSDTTSDDASSTWSRRETDMRAEIAFDVWGHPLSQPSATWRNAPKSLQNNTGCVEQPCADQRPWEKYLMLEDYPKTVQKKNHGERKSGQ